MSPRSKSARRDALRRRWKPQEDLLLLMGLGSYGWAWFQRRLGRSRESIQQRARKIARTSSFTRGVYTLNRLARETGYQRCQLRRAQAALGQKWRRMGARGVYLISSDQAEELTNWLAHDYWGGPRRYCCSWCGTSRRPPKALGLCEKCYYQYRRLCILLGLPPRADGLKTMVLVLYKGRGDDRELRSMLDRLDAGLALDRRQLHALGTIVRSQCEI